MNIFRFLNSITTIPFLILLFLSGCEKKEINLSKMNEIDNLIEEHTDSAIVLLANIDIKDLKTDKEKARYGLLMSYADFKMGLPITKDSLLIFSENYYREKGNEFDRMRILTLYGKQKFNKGENSEAILSLTKGKEIANKLKDDYWDAKITEIIADILSSSNYFEEAIPLYHSASISYKKSYKRINQLFSLADMAKSYLGAGEYEEYRILMDSIKTIKEIDSIPPLKSYLNQIELYNFVNQRDTIESLRIATSIGQDEIDYFNCDGFANMALTFIMNDSIEKAKIFLDKASRARNSLADSISVIHVNSLINAHKGDYFEAFNESEKIPPLLNIRSQRAFCNSPIVTQREYYTNQSKINEMKRIYNSYLFIGIILLLVLIFYIIVSYYFKRLKLREKEAEFLIKELNEADSIKANLDKDLEKLNSELIIKKIDIKNIEKDNRKNIESLNHKILSLFRQQWDTLNNLSNDLLNIEDDEKHSMIVVKNIYNEIKGIRSPKKFREIEKQINKIQNNLLSRFKENCDFLTEDNYKMVTLLCAGLSPKAVCIILGINYKTLYGRRTKLIEKIGNSNFEHKKLILNLIK